MAFFEEWRWAGYWVRQALAPFHPPSMADKRTGADASQSKSANARDNVASLYEAKISENEGLRAEAVSARTGFYWYAAGFIVATCFALYLSTITHQIPLWLALLPLIAGVLAFLGAGRCNRRLQDASCLLDLYRDRLRRICHQWMGKGDTGSDLEMDGHLSSADLDLFGEGSLFELLCDVHTPAGRETLAQWLQVPAEPEEVISRQQCLRDLRDRIDLREKLALLGVGKANEYSWNTFRDWLTADPVCFPRWSMWTALLLSISMVSTGACWWLGFLMARSALWLMSGIAATEGSLALWLRGRVRHAMEGLLLSARKLDSMRRLCALVEGEKWETPGLLDLQLRLTDASKSIAQLQRLLVRFEARRNEWLFYFFLLLMWGTQWAVRIERWRQHHGRELLEWLSALGEFETLMAIASYAFENPDDPNPAIATDGPLFDAVGMGHPLMAPAICVRNDVKLDLETRFLMVTGSNMSGKSTLLRAVGLNATLAWMGAPVRTKSLRLSQLQICASIRVEDSLLHGRSHFYAEVQQLRAILDRATSGPPVLFLIDELFAGTNSADRRIAAEAVLRLLIDRQAIGLVTSHDLALTEIAEKLAPRGTNVHLSDVPSATGLSFDYRLRQGKLDHGNALKIIQMVGIPLE